MTEKKTTTPDGVANAAEKGISAVVSPAADDILAGERTPTPEEIEAMLEGRNRTHFEGLGDAWGVLTGQNPAHVVPQVLGTVLSEGGTRPAWRWKRKNVEQALMAWPKDQPIRAAALFAGTEGERMYPKNVLPLLEGLPNDLTVEAVHPWENGFCANVAVSMQEDKNPMWFCDPLYTRDQDDLTPGVTHTFLLSGLAFHIRKALLDELTITQGPRYEAYAEAWLGENPGKSRLDIPPLKIDVAGKHIILPGRNFAEYQIRAMVEKVQDCQLERMPVKILYFRFPFENRPPLLLPLYVSQLTLNGLDPREGMEVDAYIWLQGRIIDLDPSPANTGA